MRIIFFSDGITIILCFVVWFTIQLGTVLICLYLPNRIYLPNRFLFKTRKWERNGRIYEQLILVKKWKHLLPDGGRITKKRGFKKKTLDIFDKDTLERFLIESSRGELTHILPILFFWIFWLFTPPPVPWIMLAYALLSNIPCIIVQRYNRPRVIKLLGRFYK